MAINIGDLISPIQGTTQPEFNALGQIKTGYITPDYMIYRFISVLIWVFSLAAILLLLYAGATYATAGGDPDKAMKAKKMLIGTIVGILIFSGAYLIYRTTIKVINTTGSNAAETILNEPANEGITNGTEVPSSAQGGTGASAPTTKQDSTGATTK